MALSSQRSNSRRVRWPIESKFSQICYFLHRPICWDTPSENTGLWQLPKESSAFKNLIVTSVPPWKCLVSFRWCKKSHLSLQLDSGSMEPAFHRGDLLFLTNYQEDPIRVGEIVVFKIEGRDIPIVHRVLKLHEQWVESQTFYNNCLKSYIGRCQNNPWHPQQLAFLKWLILLTHFTWRHH